MCNLRISEWRKLPVSLTELCINTTLRCGQSFRWKKSEDGDWSCALHGRIFALRQDSNYLHYRSIFPDKTGGLLTPPPSTPGSMKIEDIDVDGNDTETFVRHYFNLDVNLTALYDQWSRADSNFRKRAPRFTGVRILRQDAWEALVGFICSSNNNIPRISQMVDKLCRHYGPLIGHFGGEAYHDFPTPAALTGDGVESHLRQLGFGYRAKYLHQTAILVAKDHDDNWLESLRNPENPQLGVKIKSAGNMAEGGREGYRKAHEALLRLQGVGPKVADCVCLMGLGWGEAVPVDTHVWQIAQRDYNFGKGKHSSLTKATYDAVGNKFRNLWGKEAGWAHSVLFTADLRAFSDRGVAKIEVKAEEIKVDIKQELNSPKSERRVRVKTEILLTPVPKRVMEESEAASEEDMMSRVKRRRRQREISNI